MHENSLRKETPATASLSLVVAVDPMIMRLDPADAFWCQGSIGRVAKLVKFAGGGRWVVAAAAREVKTARRACFGTSRGCDRAHQSWAFPSLARTAGGASGPSPPCGAEAAEVVKGKGSEPQSIILEVELDHFAWGKLGAFPAHSLKVEKIPRKYWLVFQNIEAVATEPAAVGMDHAFGAALRNFDLGCDRVVAVEHLGSIPMRDSGDRLAGVSENVPSSGDIRPRRNKARRRRCIQRQHLIFGEFYPQEVLHFLELGCVLCRDIFGLRPVLANIIEFPFVAGRRIEKFRPYDNPWGPDDLRRKHPTIVIKTAHAHHFEVLRGAC